MFFFPPFTRVNSTHRHLEYGRLKRRCVRVTIRLGVLTSAFPCSWLGLVIRNSPAQLSTEFAQRYIVVLDSNHPHAWRVLMCLRGVVLDSRGRFSLGALSYAVWGSVSPMVGNIMHLADHPSRHSPHCSVFILHAGHRARYILSHDVQEVIRASSLSLPQVAALLAIFFHLSQGPAQLCGTWRWRLRRARSP